jgi:hypothetical protein
MEFIHSCIFLETHLFMKLTYVKSALGMGLLCCGLFSCQSVKKPPLADANQGHTTVRETVELASEPSFPGGSTAWTKHLTQEIEANMDDLTEENVSGTVVISFTVDTSGQVTNARVESCCESGKKNCASPDTKLAQVALQAVTKVPRWEPARRAADGKPVKSIKKQPVTFRLEQS